MRRRTASAAAWRAALLSGAALIVAGPALGQTTCSDATVTQNGFSGLDRTCTVAGSVGQTVGTIATGPAYNGATTTNNGTISVVAPSAVKLLPFVDAGIVLYGVGVSSDSNSSTYNGQAYVRAPLLAATNNGTIALGSSTAGPVAGAGIFALSLGAQGIDNGSSNDANSVPGNQFAGRNGGAVTVTNNGAVNVTANGFAPALGLGGMPVPTLAGIYASSVGGAGNGDDSSSGIGTGGNGDAVTVSTGQGSQINLSGQYVAGIFAQSAGGQGAGYSGSHHNWSAGGNAATVSVGHAGTITGTAANQTGIYAFSVGGSGGATDNKDSGDGGYAGNVRVGLAGTGSISMQGDGSIGVYAVSAGGLSWYAQGGNNHNGGGADVTVTLDAGATVTTNGELAAGIVAASTGGNSNTSQQPPDSLENGGTQNAIPTTRAAPGFAGNVSVSNAGTVSTQGDVAAGIVAVSAVGGTIIGMLESQGQNQIGPGPGTTGTASVTNSGGIATTGGAAFGILAASIGGPGGVIDTRPGLLNLLGGDSTNNNATSGGTVTVNNTGAITTSGAAATAILAESIGGGGGTAGGTGGIFAVGSNGGAGGDGSTVTVTQAGGGITTTGDGAFGILAHSIGGGGGNGGNATGLLASVGGQGGVGGNGGSATIVLSGPGGIATQGDFAPAVGVQSIGGGGGNGGYGKTYAPTFISAAVGGSGSGGGSGGTVAFTNGQTITTSGNQSHGVLAHSIGGGGGNGGAATDHSLSGILGLTIAVGGNGSVGGDGGQVTAANNGSIITGGPDSTGMITQSIGGGGGNAGGAAAKNTVLAGDPEIPTIAISFAWGGNGGASGSGGTVIATNDGLIQTAGNGSIGILAQSIGGGGGSGGDSTAASTAIAGKSDTIKIGVSLGGGGGASGYGGAVTVTNGGSGITTAGDNAAGIIAQSIGGGGGNGGAGNASTASPNLGGTVGNSYSATYAMGGGGGAAGGGGTVAVTNSANATIATGGSGSQGILAQSIGGGGGNAGGGSAAGSGDTLDINVSVGGSGGAAGTGGGVTVTNNGTITTRRGDAVGIAAQSIGGGGGTAGSSDASASANATAQIENVLNPPAKSYIANVTVGGNGGAGGDGGTVGIINTGNVTTQGIRAYGLLAQSIGSGGGSGGASTSTSNSAAGNSNGASNTYSGTVSVGGSGSAAGNGQAVSINTSGTVATAGYGAHAILAQSIGGGGGIGAEGSVSSTTTIALGLGVGGNDAPSGNGGRVTVVNDGTLATVGDDAYGIVAQSIGGGGGLGSATCTNSANAGVNGLSATACFGNSSVSGNWGDSSSLTLTVGGQTAAAGTGADVEITHNGTIVTTGARAFGIVAQSIGGGGGLAAGAAANLKTVSVGSVGLGAGGNVSITLGGGSRIATSGAGAWGILAQSIGGGGGFGGDSSLGLMVPASNQFSVSVTGSMSYPNAGNVTITSAGTITTTGANAHGIVAQAVGGGGGITAGGGSANGVVAGNNAIGLTGFGGWTGNLTINQTGGTIQTSGPGSIGIVAQSTGREPTIQLPIAVTVGGTVIGGTGGGAAGILVSGGGIGVDTGSVVSPANTITVNAGGSVSTMNGVSGTAIVANSGTTNLVNNGTVTGSIDLGAPVSVDRATAGAAGTVTNSGTLNAGATINAGLVTNSGRINAGGAGATGTTTISGNYVQGSGGALVVDVNAGAAQRADRVNVTGSAQLAGLVVPNAVNLLPGSTTILSAGSLASTARAQSSVPFTWALGTQGNSLTLTPQANFRPTGIALTHSHGSLADYFGNAWSRSDAGLGPIFATLNQAQTADGYTRTLAQFSPQATQSQANALANLAPIMLGAAMSCPVFVNDGTLLGEDTCAWAKVSGIWANQGSTGTMSSYRVSGAIYRIGAQKQVADNWFVGASLATGQSWSTMNNGGSGNGRAYDGSVSVKYVAGPWTFSGALAAATGSFNNSRYAGPQTAGNLVQSDTKAHLIGGRLRGAYDFAFGDWYLRPYADLDLVHLYNPAFQEYGGGAYGLSVRSSSKTSVVISPMVEIGGRRDFADGLMLRPYVAAGVNVNPNNRRTIQASFLGASAQSGTFDTTVDAPKLLGALDIGVQLYREHGFEVKAEYSLRAGDSYVGQSGSLRVGYHF